MTSDKTNAAIYCDDCGREKMAEVRAGKLVIRDRRHGQRHVAVVPLSDVERWIAAASGQETVRPLAQGGRLPMTSGS